VLKAIWHKGCIGAERGRFNRIRQVSPMCTPSNARFFGPSQVHIPNSTTIGSAIFAQLTADNPYTLQWAAPCPPPSKLTMHGVSGPHLIPGYLGPPKSITQTAPWSVQPLSWQTYRLTHWPTDRPRYCICNNRLLIYVRSSMMQSKNWHIQQRWWRELV